MARKFKNIEIAAIRKEVEVKIDDDGIFSASVGRANLASPSLAVLVSEIEREAIAQESIAWERAVEIISGSEYRPATARVVWVGKTMRLVVVSPDGVNESERVGHPDTKAFIAGDWSAGPQPWRRDSGRRGPYAILQWSPELGLRVAELNAQVEATKQAAKDAERELGDWVAASLS